MLQVRLAHLWPDFRVIINKAKTHFFDFWHFLKIHFEPIFDIQDDDDDGDDGDDDDAHLVPWLPLQEDARVWRWLLARTPAPPCTQNNVVMILIVFMI